MPVHELASVVRKFIETNQAIMQCVVEQNCRNGWKGVCVIIE